MDLIKEVEHGGSFLMHKSTLKNFRKNKGWQPSISDWNSYEMWKKAEYTDIEERAAAKVRDIIDAAEPILDMSVAKALTEYIESCD